ncbi:hypothetical protein GA0070624_4900 [Micromonospora rhizosphaerae]|uniref:CARDB domain-containing protein n=1 Tax=Micromonospora rhizosphaerae TaxID=568872 RepID=A0A1C6SX71_9ACTN|nr:hypothetical protein [Micromonospora rhizosphaerae]SCL34090.1 hypothetical protein GA0070624_4900 [Micromonospora rhizosphaerae]
MRTGLALAGLLLALAVPAGRSASAAAAPPPLPGAVEIAVDQNRLNAVVGERLTLESRVVNSGDAPTDRLVAHLNVASLDGVYVDLEDWSADVTREVPPVAPSSSTSLTWEFQAVNTGSFDVYLVLMPNGGSTAGTGPLVVSQPVHVTVAGKRTLTAAGSLPVAVVVPIVLGLVAAAARYRIRRPA